MKKISLFLALSVSLSSIAGVKEDKAKAEGEAKLKTDVEAVKKACGNAKLAVAVDWAQWDNADYIKAIGKEKAEILSNTYGLISGTLTSLSELCAADKDYKGAVAKIEEVKVSAKKDPKDTTANFSKKDKAFVAELNGDGYTGASNPEKIKKAFD